MYLYDLKQEIEEKSYELQKLQEQLRYQCTHPREMVKVDKYDVSLNDENQVWKHYYNCKFCGQSWTEGNAK